MILSGEVRDGATVEIKAGSQGLIIGGRAVGEEPAPIRSSEAGGAVVPFPKGA
jgi:hypothetical protein